jgi:hypothetical protein
MWWHPLNCFIRFTRPLPVILMRFATDRLVRILGMETAPFIVRAATKKTATRAVLEERQDADHPREGVRLCFETFQQPSRPHRPGRRQGEKQRFCLGPAKPGRSGLEAGRSTTSIAAGQRGVKRYWPLMVSLGW